MEEKTTPSSVAGCLVRISGSTVVCSDHDIDVPTDYSPWSAVGGETGKFHGTQSRQRASRWGRNQYVGKCLCNQAEVSQACVTWLAIPGRNKPTRTSFFVRLYAKMNPWRGRKAVRKRPRKSNGKSISGSWAAKLIEWPTYLQTNFGEGKHGQAPAIKALFVLCDLHDVHSLLPESIKAYSLNLNA